MIILLAQHAHSSVIKIKNQNQIQTNSQLADDGFQYYNANLTFCTIVLTFTVLMLIFCVIPIAIVLALWKPIIFFPLSFPCFILISCWRCLFHFRQIHRITNRTRSFYQITLKKCDFLKTKFCLFHCPTIDHRWNLKKSYSLL